MESEWLRLEHRGTSSSRQSETRHWFSCEIPDEDENSGDDDWSHVADVFVDFQSGIISRINVVMTHDIDTIFDAEPVSGHFQKVIIESLRTFFNDSFNSRVVPLYCSKFKAQADFLYNRDVHELI